MATPTRTQVLLDDQVAAMDARIRMTPADVIMERSTLLGLLWKSAKEPGIELPDLKRVGIGSPRFFRKSARELWIPVANQRSSSFTPFRHADILPVAIDPVMTVQRAVYSYYTEFAAITWQEAEENSGSDAVIDIFDARWNMTLRTMSESLETDLWSANLDTSDSQKRIIGLRTLIADDPTTGTVWNINRADHTWQRNNFDDAAGAFSVVGMDAMRSMWTACAGNGGVDPPGLIVSPSVIFDAYQKVVEDKYQFFNLDMAKYGFPAAAVFRGTPYTYSEACPAGKQYFMNLGYWTLCMPPGADFKPYEIGMTADQMIAYQRRVVWGGQWGCERFDRQGVIFGYTDV